MNKIRVASLCTLVPAGLFSLLCVHFCADVSFAAFPLGALFSAAAAFFLFVRVVLRRDFSAVPAARKLLQYLPFALLAAFILRRAGRLGTAYWYDVVTVLLWCAVFVASLATLFFLNPKRILSVVPEWQEAADRQSEKAGRKKGAFVTPGVSARRVALEVLDWVDALVQAVFMVLLIQIFILQLYVIPSESMVPAFLVNDRVVVFKTASGPKFPLSDVGLPCLRKYSRGDVVVFRNPHYSLDRRSEVRTVVSQILYMLTFTGVNLNVDASGQPKADPLVKRICGVPGEQLVMQDGILYARTADSDGFAPVRLDEKFAAWNLNTVPAAVLRGIQHLPLSQSDYEAVLAVEAERRALDWSAAAAECREIAAAFQKLHSAAHCQAAADFGGPGARSAAEVPLFEYALFHDNADNTLALLAADDGADWFSAFMTEWADGMAAAEAAFSDDMYAAANYALNLMIKRCVGRLFVRNAELYAQGAAPAQWGADDAVFDALSEAERLNFYLLILDQRNMPVFPADDADGNPCFIPEGK
nr:signal peptidase I [Treponemataceae bacterium]